MQVRKATFEDKDTWKSLASGDTNGIFQVESSGLTETLKRLQIKNFSTLVDVVALYRPGPLDAGMLDTYVRRKRGREPVTVDHELLEPILRNTEGIILFQEQCLEIACELAGYTKPEADLFRKAISKKNEEVLNQERSKFVSGCMSFRGLSEKLATTIFNQIVTFAGYAFNKSHSVSYAMITYWTAYLKANFTIEYQCGLLGSQNDEENIRKYIRDTKDHEITVGPPHVNESDSSFSISNSEDNTIVFGLSKIKGIGTGVADHIISLRPFTGFIDFLNRIDRKAVSSDLVEKLVKAGCFRKLDKDFTTKQILENLKELIEIYKCKKFAVPKRVAKLHLKTWAKQVQKMQEDMEYTPLQLAHMERETLGFYVTTHPMLHLQNPKALESKSYIPLGHMDESGVRQFYTIGVVTDRVRTKKSRRGSVFYELEVEDEHNIYKFAIFGNKLQQTLESLKLGDIVALKMKKSRGRLYPEDIRIIN